MQAALHCWGSSACVHCWRLLKMKRPRTVHASGAGEASRVARLRLSAADSAPCSARGSSTFSRAVSCAMRLKVWKTKPRRFRRIAAKSLSGVESHIPRWRVSERRDA